MTSFKSIISSKTTIQKLQINRVEKGGVNLALVSMVLVSVPCAVLYFLRVKGNSLLASLWLATIYFVFPLLFYF